MGDRKVADYQQRLPRVLCPAPPFQPPCDPQARPERRIFKIAGGRYQRMMAGNRILRQGTKLLELKSHERTIRD